MLLAGIIYIILSDDYMGIARDLIYREYIFTNEYLVYINYTYLMIFWIFVSVCILKKTLNKFTLYLGLNLFIFLILSISSFLYHLTIFPSIFLFICLNIFASFRLILFLITIKISIK